MELKCVEHGILTCRIYKFINLPLKEQLLIRDQVLIYSLVPNKWGVLTVGWAGNFPGYLISRGFLINGETANQKKMYL